MHSFFRNKFLHFYRDTPQVVTILNHLRVVYPYILPTIDHVAFRHIGLEPPIDQMLINFGFKNMGRISLPLPSTGEVQKNAHWFKKSHMPMVFSSYANLSEGDDLAELKLTDHYVKWTLEHGAAINHIALDLSDYPDNLKQIMDLISDDLDIRMNDQGRVQTSTDGLLLQGSCKSVSSGTGTGSRKGTGTGKGTGFVEFIQRKIDPETGKKRDGFDAFNAAAIFESTSD